MRELLEEARDRLLQNTPHRPGTCVECDNNRSTIAKITAALTEPEPDAMEIVRKIREGATFGHDLSERYCKLLDTEAAALIEDYGRRVLRAMLIELWATGAFCSGMESETERKATINAIAAKYGVKLED
jgi:hypothetical protein